MFESYHVAGGRTFQCDWSCMEDHGVSDIVVVFLKWKINEFTLKVRNDITVGPPLTATSLRRPFFGGEGGGGQSMYSLFFQPLYNGHLSTTASFFLGGRGRAVHVFTLLSTSLEWPLSSVPKVAVVQRCYCMYWRINLCIQLMTLSSSVLVLKTDYTWNICLRFEHGLSWNHSPFKEIWIKLCRVTRPKHSLHFSFHFCYLHSTLHLLSFVITY